MAVMLVHPDSLEQRLEIIRLLESDGFSCAADSVNSWEGVVDSDLPLCIDIVKKTIRRIGNVTCAAAAASSKKIISPELFYELYADWKKGRYVMDFYGSSN